MKKYVDEIVFLILNYNCCELTKKCVNSIREMCLQFKVVIVDNDSFDNSYKILNSVYAKENNIYLIKSTSNVGYAKGNNIGFKFIEENIKSAKYVVVMNPDIVIWDIEVIKNLYAFLEKYNDYAIVSCQSVFNNEWRMGDDYGWKYPTKINLFWAGTIFGKLFVHSMNEKYTSLHLIDNELATAVDVVSGCFFMARLDDIKKVDYFDDRTFLYYEENIISKKLLTINKKEAILLNYYFYHNHQHKDKSLIDYKKRLFDRKCFHDSKMIYINNYSNITGVLLLFCKFVNNVDFQIKKIVFGFLAIIKP